MMMKPLVIAGLVLIVLGVLALVTRGITYNSRETVANFGPISVTAQRERTIGLPTVLGGLAVVGGAALIIAAGRRRA
jgi:hypothetical protein